MRIAIVGSGISGLTAAYLLYKEHDITVYEQNDYIGGHANTFDADLHGATYPVDTGFIVFNKKTYPNFVRLLTELGVAWKDSTMSFSVHCDRTGLEYSPSSLRSLFAQKRNIVRPRFLRMVREIFRFRRNYENMLSGPVDPTLAELLEQENYSRYFRDYFIIPMGAAIWSADPEQFGNIPAQFFVRFFHNHGFLNVSDQPQWLTIRGGSRMYVQALTQGFKDRIRLNVPVTQIQRFDDHVRIKTEQNEDGRFDHVILACHSDQALRLLDSPTDAEQSILGSVPYQENLAVLHTDTTLLPLRRKAWASWNYRIPSEAQSSVILTYNMTILQSIDAPETLCVTLNQDRAIDPATRLYEIAYAHPMFTGASVEAQKKHKEISGVNRTHFCGAYWGNGFHEDGVKSALAACSFFGKEW